MLSEALADARGRAVHGPWPVPLGVLPLGTPDGCPGRLVVVGETGRGVGGRAARLPERYAHAIAGRLRGKAGVCAPVPLLGRIGRDTVPFDLIGIFEDDFDGKTDTLLSFSAPAGPPR